MSTLGGFRVKRTCPQKARGKDRPGWQPTEMRAQSQNALLCSQHRHYALVCPRGKRGNGRFSSPFSHCAALERHGSSGASAPLLAQLATARNLTMQVRARHVS